MKRLTIEEIELKGGYEEISEGKEKESLKNGEFNFKRS